MGCARREGRIVDAFKAPSEALGHAALTSNTNLFQDGSVLRLHKIGLYEQLPKQPVSKSIREEKKKKVRLV